MKVDFKSYASLLSAESADADGIASWLADREMEKESKAMAVDETVQDSESVSAEAEVYDENLAVSQIRILSKRYTTEPDVIPFVAVIDKWDDEMWLIVPFSLYRTPATPGEMTTGMNVHSLHVLQAWNGRTVQGEILKRSYLVGALPEDVRMDALRLFRHQLFGTPLPEEFAARRGAPIVEAADPRRDHLAESVARLQPLTDAVLELAEGSTADVRRRVIDFLFDRYLSPENGYALAAATDDDEGRIPVLMKKDAWDAMMDGRDASDFCGYSTCEGGQKALVAYLCGDLPHEFDGKDELPVLACERKSRAVVGKGVLTRQVDGRCKIVVRLGEGVEHPVEIQNVRDLVLVLQEQTEDMADAER